MPLVLGEVRKGAPLKECVICRWLQIGHMSRSPNIEQFGRATVELHVAKEQISELQMELAGKRNKVTNDKLALIALQNTQRASVKASIHCI